MTNFSPDEAPPLSSTYSQISKVPISSNAWLVSIAGQTGARIDNGHEISFQEQVRNALANVDTCLKAAGASKKSIVSLRQYVVKLGERDPEDAKTRAGLITEWWKSTEGQNNPPPSTLIGVHSLVASGIEYEIEVTCVCSE